MHFTCSVKDHLWPGDASVHFGAYAFCHFVAVVVVVVIFVVSVAVVVVVVVVVVVESLSLFL